MRIISCGSLSYKLLLIAFAPVCNSLLYFFVMLISQNNILHPITLTFITYLSQVFAGLGFIYFFVIAKLQRKGKKESKLAIETVPQFQKIEAEEISLKKPNLMLLALSFISFIYTIVINFMTINYGTINEKSPKRSIMDFQLLASQIVYICVLSRFILKYSLYYHQIVSLVIDTVAFCFVFFPNLQNENWKYIKIPVYLATNLLASVRFVCEKWLMEERTQSPHKILFFEGAVGVLLSIILGFISGAIESWNKVLGSTNQIFVEIGACFKVFGYEILYIFSALISCVAYNLLIMFIRYFYTPMHCVVSNIITAILMMIALAITNTDEEDMNNDWATGIGNCLLIIGLLIYNELVIINVFGLEEYTAQEISKRSKAEFTQEISFKLMEEEANKEGIKV